MIRSLIKALIATCYFAVGSFLAALLVLGILKMWYAEEFAADMMKHPASELAVLGAFAPFVFYFLRSEFAKDKLFPLSQRRSYSIVLGTALSFCVLLILSMLVFPNDPQLASAFGYWEGLNFVAKGILVPLTTGIFLRSFIQKVVLKEFGVNFQIIGTALIFGVLSALETSSARFFAPMFGLGVCLSYLSHKEGWKTSALVHSIVVVLLMLTRISLFPFVSTR